MVRYPYQMKCTKCNKEFTYKSEHAMLEQNLYNKIVATAICPSCEKKQKETEGENKMNTNIVNDSMYKGKFLVINRKYIEETLNPTEFAIFATLLEKIHKEANLKDHDYLVVNQDEPYAEDIWKIIKNGEDKKNNSLKD